MAFDAYNREGTYTVKYDDAKKKFGKDGLLPLWVADMDLASPACVQHAIAKRASHPIYGYTVYPQAYYEAIGNWMKKRFALEIDKKSIVPCYGVVGSLNFALHAYTNEGDGVIIQTPIYPPFESSVRHQKRVLLENQLQYANGMYSMDFEDFEAKAKKAKLFLFCSPHNPTGRVWEKEELEQIIAICNRHNVVIVCDEIHADIVYDKQHYPLIGFDAIKEQTILLNAPSKTFNIAGLNSSYAIIPNHKLRQRYIIEQNKSGITNGNPFGIEALISAYSKGEQWLESLKVHLVANIAYIHDFLHQSSLPIVATPTEATFLMWLDCSAMGLSHQALVDFFVKDAKLGLNDGKSFGNGGEGFMRLNIGTSKAILQEAMKRLENAWEAKK